MNVERLKELLDYNPETGIFTHKKVRSGVPIVGVRAGSIGSSRGERYESISVYGKLYKAHRLAWMYIHGSMPSKDIDHINGNTLDNRIVNLRNVSKSVNCKNKTKMKNNKTGVTGVYWSNRFNKFHAQISSEGKKIHLGWFDELESAKEARQSAEVKYGFHSGHGRNKAVSSCYS